MKKDFQYHADIQQITAIQEDITSIKKEWSLPGPEVRQILMVVEEIFSKLIQNPVSDDEEHIVELFVYKEGDLLNFNLRDNSEPYNPFDQQAINSLDLSFTEPDNMGIALVKTFVDTYSYTRIDDMNVYTFQKSIKSI